MNLEWVPLENKRPELNEWVLVPTMYCIYPVTIARWIGYEFRCQENTSIANVSHYAKISRPTLEFLQININDKEKISASLEHINYAIECVREIDFKNENINEVYDQLGKLHMFLCNEKKSLVKDLANS